MITVVHTHASAVDAPVIELVAERSQADEGRRTWPTDARRRGQGSSCRVSQQLDQLGRCELQRLVKTQQGDRLWAPVPADPRTHLNIAPEDQIWCFNRVLELLHVDP